MKYKIINPKIEKEIILLKSFHKKIAPAIFTRRQLEVLEKKLKGITLTQTEKNYLSNSIKRKFEALTIIFNQFDFKDLTNHLYNRKNIPLLPQELDGELKINKDRTLESEPRFRGILKKLLSAQRISIITGAGISTNSGLESYRGKGGLWTKIDPLKYLSEEGFLKNHDKTLQILNELKQKIKNAKPNIIHSTLALMEHLFDSFSITTQNIDGYHQKAGSNRIFELHGNIHENKRKKGIIMPDIKLFGEDINTKAYKYAHNAITNSEILLIIGTSGYFDYIADLVKSCPGYIIEINPEKTRLSKLCDAKIREKAETILPRIYNQLLRNRLLQEFRKNFRNKQIKSIYLYGSTLRERRLPKDIDLLIIPQKTEIKPKTILDIKNRIFKISGREADIETTPLADLKHNLDNHKRNILFTGILLYGENIKGELYGVL